MIDNRTLGELRRHWKYYAEFSGVSNDRLKRFHKEQSNLSKSVLEKYTTNLSPSRSAGMLWHEAMKPVATLFRKYWETGTTFTSLSEIKSATNINPTFLYSLSGEVFNPHYGSFPAGFHLMPAFAPIATDPAGPLSSTGSPAINVCKQQFKAWGESFRAARAANSIIIRFHAGEAIAFCRALNEFNITGQTSTNIFVSAWRAPQINLGELGTSAPRGPTVFDVIDTSNLTDHLGLLNLLIVTQPLLKNAPKSQSVLYTETLLRSGEDATQSFLARICTDVPTISSLLGLAPRAYVSGFTTQSNVHELLFSDMSAQFHERVAWVNPASGDYHYTNQVTITFEVEALAHAIFGIYDSMFTHEKTMTSLLAKPSAAGLMAMGEVHFQRETVAILLRAIQARIRVQNGDWDQVTSRFLDLVDEDKSRLIEPNNLQELILQLHLHGVHTDPLLQPHLHNMFRKMPRTNIFDHWPTVPPVACVVLTVPRKSLKVFFDDPEWTGTPTLQCFLRVERANDNTYSAVHAIWGKCITLPDSNATAIQEDTHGMNGQSDLVVSFWAHTRLLEIPGTYVALGVKSTPQAVMQFMGTMGVQLEVFKAGVTNKQHVRILTYRPTLASETPYTLRSFPASQPHAASDYSCQAIVDTKRGDRCVSSLSVRFDVGSAAEQESLLKGAAVSATQIASCTLELVIGQYRHPITYPYPIQGNSHKLRIARKSHYVEVRHLIT